LACAAALEVIRVIETENYCERAMRIAEFCKKRFLSWQSRWEQLVDVRGIGAMMGLEFVKDKESMEHDGKLVSALVDACAKKGLIIESAGAQGNIVRFLCPLCVTEQQLSAGLDIMEAALISLLD
jgi:4-aminobutyrate aminotransferase/(S)-3-amino-2-methylpropionate transaminase